ncbi:MAG: 16S rRNA (guanine(527)-N(7))-methyltransferase RsmG [Bulleidia sp.]
MTLEELRQKAGELGISLTEEMLSQLSQDAVLLREWNEKMNLTAITEPEEVYQKHFLDCLIPLSEAEIHGTVCDVGSGAGFPGIIWAIARPDLKLVLLEPTGKRVAFLNEVISQLMLENVIAVNERAEDYARKHRESFDAVTARAVAPLPILAELCIPLLKKNGVFVAMKGSRGREEAEDAGHAVSVLGAEKEKIVDTSLESGDLRTNLIYRKVKSTPAEYPRPYARIHKKPL